MGTRLRSCGHGFVFTSLNVALGQIHFDQLKSREEN